MTMQRERQQKRRGAPIIHARKYFIRGPKDGRKGNGLRGRVWTEVLKLIPRFGFQKREKEHGTLGR